MVAGLINCGLALGAATGPVLAGVAIDMLDFAWAETVVAGLSALMVSYQDSTKLSDLNQQCFYF